MALSTLARMGGLAMKVIEALTAIFVGAIVALALALVVIPEFVNWVSK